MNLELFMEVSEETGSRLNTHVLFICYFRQYTKMWKDNIRRDVEVCFAVKI